MSCPPPFDDADVLGLSLLSLVQQEALADPFVEQSDSHDAWPAPPLSPNDFPDLMLDEAGVFGHAAAGAAVVPAAVVHAAVVIPAAVVSPAVAAVVLAPEVPLVVIDDSDSGSDEGNSGNVDDGRPYVALRRRLAIDRDGDCIFSVTMPDGAPLRFSNISAALHAFQCYCLDREGLMLQRPDLAVAFSKDGDLGWLSGARTQAHRFQLVLAREGLAVHADAWAQLQEGLLHVVVLARALADEDFARDCRVAVLLRLTQSLPLLCSSLDKLAQAMNVA
jgi:hypothetical protein